MNHKSSNKTKLQENATQTPFSLFFSLYLVSNILFIESSFCYTTWLTEFFLRNCFCFILSFFAHDSVHCLLNLLLLKKKTCALQFSCVIVGIAIKLMSLPYLLKILTKCKPILFGM